MGTPWPACFSPHITQDMKFYSVIPAQSQITCGWARAYLWEKNTQSTTDLAMFSLISTLEGNLHSHNCSENDEHLQRALWQRCWPGSLPKSSPRKQESLAVWVSASVVRSGWGCLCCWFFWLSGYRKSTGPSMKIVCWGFTPVLFVLLNHVF